ncbi:MAG TPA: endospore germination permease, partial [Negativicutes bacterium]|nr:endospore germination permease [Negativicutes bacterium]
ISPYQVATILIMTVISVGVFSIAADAAKAVGTDGWIMVAIAGLVNIPAILVIVKLNSVFPGKTFAEYSQKIIGVIPGKALTALFAVYLLLVIAYVTRAFTEVVKMFLLFRTPTEVIMLSLILVCTYIVRGGAECIGRINELTFPIAFIPFFLVLVFGFPNLNFSNLLPVFQTSPAKMATAVPSLLFSYGGIELSLFYIGFMKEPKKAYKPAIIAVLFITMFLVVITVLCIAAFGPEATQQFLWPLVSYIRAISLPGLFIERLDGVILSLWMLTVFTTMVTSYFVVGYSISRVVGTKEQKQYIVPLSIVIYYLALQPDSLAALYTWGGRIFPYAISTFLYAVPVLLLIIARIRKLGVRR